MYVANSNSGWRKSLTSVVQYSSTARFLTYSFKKTSSSSFSMPFTFWNSGLPIFYSYSSQRCSKILKPMALRTDLSMPATASSAHVAVRHMHSDFFVNFIKAAGSEKM